MVSPVSPLPRLAVLWFFLWFSGVLSGAVIHLDLRHECVDDRLTVTITNRSATAVHLTTIEAELDGASVQVQPEAAIPAGQEGRYQMRLQYPAHPGTHALIVRVYYLNDGQTFSLLNVGQYHYRRAGITQSKNDLGYFSIQGEAEVVLRVERPEEWRVLLPREVRVLSEKNVAGQDGGTGEKILQLGWSHYGFSNEYPFYLLANRDRPEGHGYDLREGRLKVQAAGGYRRGWIPDKVLIVILLVCLPVGFWLIQIRPATGRFEVALAKYTARIFFAGALYLFFRHLPSLLLFTEHHAPWLWLHQWIPWGIANHAQSFLANCRQHFDGGIFQNFYSCQLAFGQGGVTIYFIDSYLCFLAAVCLPYSWYWDSDKQLTEDKYSCLFAWLAGWLVAPFRRRWPEWNFTTRLGFLTLCVKFFYIPLLASWVLNNTGHQINLARSWQWGSEWAANLDRINVFLQALFIFVDTSIFAFGYCLEARFLKNGMRSVEFTWLGWIVCLWCYPPFNAFSFAFIDHAWFPIAIQQPHPTVVLIANTLIMIGWGIFAWASVAIGFKASNLTNRGIVDGGPYRFCRHPAYTVKLFIWMIEAVILGRYTMGLLTGFAIIYFLRAWTEERHLSNDPDYVAYKQKVPWRFIPKLL